MNSTFYLAIEYSFKCVSLNPVLKFDALLPGCSSTIPTSHNTCRTSPILANPPTNNKASMRSSTLIIL